MIDNILHCDFSEASYSITADIKKANNREGEEEKEDESREEGEANEGFKGEWRGEGRARRCEREGERYVCVHKYM